MAITGKSGVSTGVEIKASVIGEDLITATTTASAQSIIGVSTVGGQILGASSTAAAQSALGGSVVGRQIFEAATTAAVNTIVGGGVSSLNGQTGALSITSDDTSVAISAGVNGVDLTVNDASISVTADQVSDATTVGKAVMRAATTAAALDDLGAGAVGKLLFATATTAAAQDSLGAGTFGKAMLAAATTAAAQNALGVGTVGRQIFEAATTAAVNTIVGGGFTGSAADVPFTPGSLVHVSATNVQTAIDQIDGALERVSAASIGASTIGKSIFTATTTAAVHDLLEGGAAGLTVYKAATTAAAQNVLGIGAVGRQVFESATTAAAQTALGGGVVGRLLFATGTTAAALDNLGGGAVGKTVFAAATTAAALDSLGGGTVGKLLFATATTAAAQNALGGTAVGKSLFGATTTAAAQTIIGAFVSANFATTAQANAGTNDGTVMNPVLVKNAIAALGGTSAGLTSIATGSPTGVATVDITSIPATYRALVLHVSGISNATATRAFLVTPNAGAGLGSELCDYHQIAGTTTTSIVDTVEMYTGVTQTAANTTDLILIIPYYQSGPFKTYYGRCIAAAGGTLTSFWGYLGSATGAVEGLRLYWNGSGNFDAGSYTLYGVN